MGGADDDGYAGNDDAYAFVSALVADGGRG